MRRVDAVVIASAIGFAVCYLAPRAAALTAFPLDDAWIHLVYARSLIEGAGFAYNPGQAETGVTSPLWTLLLAPWLAIAGGHVVVAIKGFGLALHATTALLLMRLLQRLGVRDRLAALGALAIALEPYGLAAALSGMEVPLCGLLFAWLLHSLARAADRATLVALLLLPLARPEALAITLPIAIQLLRARWSTAPVSMRLALAVAPWCGFTVWAVYCVTVSGYPLPSTFYAKASPSLAAWINNLRVVPLMLLQLGPFRSVIGFGLVAWGGVLAWRLEPTPATRPRAGRALVLVALCHLAAAFVSQPLKEAHTLYWMRYVLPVAPLLIAAMIVGIDGLWRATEDKRRFVRAATLVAIAAGWVWSTPRAIEHYAWSCQNIQDIHGRAARWIAEHTAADAWIATHEAGLIRFASRRPVLDLAGLNDHRIAHGGLSDELARTRPEYFVVFPAWFPVVTRDRRFTPIYSAKAERYVISSAPQSELVVYRFDP